MNLQSLLNSTTALLLLVGLAVLFLNIIFSAIRLARGHDHAGILSVVLALAACVLITVGLVRMTFPALAGANPAPGGAFTNSGSGAPDSGPATGATPGASGRNIPPAIQTQIAQGTVPARSGGQNRFGGQNNPQGGQTSGSTGQSTGQNGGQAGRGSGQGGTRNAQTGQTPQDGPAAPAAASADIPPSRLAAVTAIGAAVIFLAGLILYFGERRRPGFEPSSSAGLLYVGAGVFVLVAALVVPGLPGQFSVARASGISVADQATSDRTERVPQQTPTPSATSVPSATPTELPTLTQMPSESPTPLFTPVAYTANADGSATTACSVTAQTGLNLRGDPSTAQMGIGKVFAGSLLPVTGQSPDKKWWRVISTDGGTPVEGWVSTEFVAPMPGCANVQLPVVGPTLTPTRTARPSATSRPSVTPRATAGSAG
jgi:Bacterial SH3 domain